MDSKEELWVNDQQNVKKMPTKWLIGGVHENNEQKKVLLANTRFQIINGSSLSNHLILGFHINKHCIFHSSKLNFI